MSNIRTRLAEIIKGCQTQVDLDTIVARAGSLGDLFRTEFPGADATEFMYEWTAVKLNIKREV